MSHRIARVMFLVIASFALTNMTMVQAQTTTFNYQGRLNDGGAVANGNYDFQFTLWDAMSGGTQQPQPSPVTLARLGVTVANGVFTVQLDFGFNALPGANRFLEIGVRPNGGGTFTTLSPRQQISSTPYAIRTLSAASAEMATNATQLGGVAASQYVQTNDSRLTDSRPPTAGSSNYIQNTTSPQSSSNFNISGSGTAGGTLTGNAINATTQYNLGGNRVLGAPGTANLFAGLGAGSANTTGSYNTFFGQGAGNLATTASDNSFFGAGAGQHNTTLGDNSFFGFAAGSNTTTGFNNSFFGSGAGGFNTTGSGNVFVGNSVGLSNTTENNNTLIGSFSNGAAGITNATAIGANASVAQSNSLVLGSINGVNSATSSVNVGIGTTSPTAKLHVHDNNADIRFSVGLDCGSIFGAITFDNASSGPSCSNYSLLGDGTNTFINRPTGGSLLFREGNVDQMIITPGGSVGIGTINPAGGFNSLDVNGRLFVRFNDPAATQQLCLNPNTKGVGTCNSSSLRYKRDSTPFIGGLNLLRRLNPITFTWKIDGTRDVGLGAEDVAKVEPLLTFRNDKGEIEGVRYDRLSVLFVNAFKEQQAQIEEQQKQIKRQEEQIQREHTANAYQQQQLDGLKNLVCRTHRRASVCK